ncbi:MAG TPA: DHHA1 domain-containing protein [Candidatus Saccharimonadales bacterium]|nr:DHHA1 domain-containing protein [Candidatus Saccharimonadales bacterium]
MQPTERLYYHDSYLYSFDAQVIEAADRAGRPAVVLDRTAFYPTSGGQVYDTGKLVLENEKEIQVAEVAEDDDGRICHYTAAPVEAGQRVRGRIDAPRRRDHIQQHSGQHVLSAAFVHLFECPTASFHMGAESCTIDLVVNDLAVKSLSAKQVVEAERLANEIIAEDRAVKISFVSLEEAQKLGVRKIPPKQTGELRLIDIADFDLTACGGTHVRSTGQIGSILVRKIENVKQGVRLEFVCGLRAVSAARQDYITLTETAALLSANVRDLPQQVGKTIQEARTASKVQMKMLEEIAELRSAQMLAGSAGSPKVLVSVFPEWDAVFIKLLAQKLTAAAPDVIALLASGLGQTAMVFAQSPGQKHNMGQLLKDTMAKLNGRGGGTADMAQGGLPAGSADLEMIEKLLRELAAGL